MAEKGAKPEPAASSAHDEAQKDDKKPLTLREACSFQQKLQMTRQADSSQPDPWVVRKISVLLVVLIFGYALYVSLVQILIPMIRRDSDARGSRTEGIILLVFWCIFWIMFVWTYLRIVFSSPGFAKDHIQQSEEPEAYDYEADLTSSSSSSVSSFSTVEGRPYEEHSVAEVNGAPPGAAVDLEAAKTASIRERRTSSAGRHETDVIAEEEPSTGALGPVIGHALRTKSSASSPEGEEVEMEARNGRTTSAAISFPEPPDGYSQSSEAAGPERKPPPYAVLSESYRWCTRCKIIKPYRAHHCRHCGTCVLKMDHHCPWVGTCVGARNYKYFFNFLQWSSVFCSYVFFVSLFAVAPPSRPEGADREIDGRQISLVIIAALFAIFTVGMLGTHVFLILHNITTIEEMAITRMKKRENAVLQMQYGWFDFPGRSNTRKRWNREWGAPHSEGNLWWLGDARKNWTMVMGKSWLPWILPIPAHPSDEGLHYEPNPRFSESGRQRRREEWPEELR